MFLKKRVEYWKKKLRHTVIVNLKKNHCSSRAPTTLKSEGEVTSLSGADKREVRDNREKW
jgi:hypothetical protein